MYVRCVADTTNAVHYYSYNANAYSFFVASSSEEIMGELDPNTGVIYTSQEIIGTSSTSQV